MLRTVTFCFTDFRSELAVITIYIYVTRSAGAYFSKKVKKFRRFLSLSMRLNMIQNRLCKNKSHRTSSIGGGGLISMNFFFLTSEEQNFYSPNSTFRFCIAKPPPPGKINLKTI